MVDQETEFELEMNPKSVRYNYIQLFTPVHVCKILFRLLNIFEKLCREERIALDHDEEEKKEVRIIFWRAMFGFEYQEIVSSEKFEIFLGSSRVFLFWHAEKWGSWLKSFTSKKIVSDQVVRVPK